MSDLISNTKFGWIPFWNLRPLYKELQAELSHANTLEKGNPTDINRLMAEGQIDLAPCSSVCLALNPSQELALPLGVACDGHVLSVYLGVKSENSALVSLIANRQEIISEALSSLSSLGTMDIRKKAELLLEKTRMSEFNVADLPNVKLSTASATSVMLTRIFYRLWFGAESYELACKLGKISENPISSSAATFELVIGDEALAKRRQYYHILDLGSLWKDLTELPFVYATWQSRKKIDPIIKKVIMAAAEKAEARMKIEPRVYNLEMPPLDDMGKVIDLEEYWQKIYYRLGKREMKALTFFLSLAKTLHPVESADAITIKIMHLQELVKSQL